jgi:hypothetical protein
LGCKCPNAQCEAIFDIYISRPFQWHQEHPNVRCFTPCGTPNPQLFQALGFTPTLGQSGVTTFYNLFYFFIKTIYGWIFLMQLVVEYMPIVALIHYMLCFDNYWIYVIFKKIVNFYFYFGNDYNFRLYQNMLTILGISFFNQKLQLCFICHVHYTSFTCGKKIFEILRF